MAKNLKWAMIGLLIALPIAGGIVFTKKGQFEAMGAASTGMTAPPTPVNAFTVVEESWQSRLAAIGSVVTVQGTALATETDGVVRSIHFEAGQTVAVGDILLKMDTQVEQAQLREAKAAAELAKTSFARAARLAKSKNISQGDLDSAQANLQRTQAQVAYFSALLARKSLRAPFAGQLGIHRINLGQYLAKGTQVVGLQALDPVFVEFYLPQRHLGRLSEGLEIAVTSDAWPGQSFAGPITAINPDVDVSTRNVRVQATLKNPQGHLRHGMYVSVKITLDEQNKVLAVPSTAIASSVHGTSVYLLEPQDAEQGDGLQLRQQPVRVGERRGDFVNVTQGLRGGEQIVSTGVFKLRSGMKVAVDNSLAPVFKLAPAPGNR